MMGNNILEIQHGESSGKCAEHEENQRAVSGKRPMSGADRRAKNPTYRTWRMTTTILDPCLPFTINAFLSSLSSSISHILEFLILSSNGKALRLSRDPNFWASAVRCNSECTLYT
ncbi:hypothetical protein LDENG_00243410 [Lucifuga dentata]|nr:hypothetical protein LDENG_00243410 [Lucifuga dentata]